MPEYVWKIGFAISIIFTSSVCILVARRVFKSGVEHFSSRILVLSGNINTCLCGLLFFTQGIYEVIRISTSDSIHTGQLLIPLVFISVPVRILWNYFTIQRKPVGQYDLQPCTVEEVNTKIAAICKTMGITPPAIMSSDIINSPFVFGRRSNRATLAIPAKWLNTSSSQQHIQLLHELSHIRNHDVGFLAWSNASLRDLRLLLILLPALIVYCFALGYSHIAPSILLYLICSLILFAMLRYVIRKRESLADLTAAMLVESGQIKDVITTQEIYTAAPEVSSRQQAKPGFADKIQRWLSDKAMFSKRKKLWKIWLEVFNFFNLLHPGKTDRLKTIASIKSLSDNAQGSSLDSSFWAGITFGLLGVIIGLGGYSLSMLSQNPHDNTEILRLPFKIYGLAAPPTLGLWSIILTLPYWSSFRKPRLDSKFLLSQLKNHGIALIGACLTCPVILTAGVSDTNVHVLTVMCATWYAFIIFFGFVFSIVSVFLWITLRYLQSSQSLNLKKSFWSFAPFTIIVLGFFITGIGLINDSQVFQGTNVLFSTFVGVAILLVVIGYSKFSENDEYFILCFFRFTFLLEGKSLKWKHRFFDVAGCPVLLIGFGLPVYLSIDLMLSETLNNISARSGLLFLIVSSCAILIIIRARDIIMIKGSKRTKLYRMSHCLQLLSKSPDSHTRKKINVVAASHISGIKDAANRILNLTMQDAYEVVSLILDDTNQSKTLGHLSKWVFRCQSEGGFGLWPTSSPRLSSTYQAISILQDVDWLDKCNADLHISWIKTLQQPGGYFKDPWSKREPWQDTFYAVKSLSILGASLDPDKANLCKNWTTEILTDKGLKSDRPDIIYFCFASLTALGKVNEDISKLVSDWLSSKIEQLLLTNISLDYENVHFTVMTYNLFGGQLNISSESINLLSDRIQTALSAELADIGNRNYLNRSA